MFHIFSKKRAAAPLCFSTDIHCHIIPGVDDGSPDAATSADLIERMQEWGIDRILASPHVTQNTFENTRATLTPALDKLRAELAARNNSIQVDHSAEYRIDELLLKHIEDGDLMPYPNDYLLIENSFMQEPWNLDQLIFDLQVRGFRPILAHPERYPYYYSRKNRLEEIRNAGAALQINLLSLAGAYGKAERNMAEHLIKKGLVGFIGTDLHKHSHADAIDAYLRTKQACKDMEALAPMVKNNEAFL
ncbi:MAG: hypothetical protein K2F63_02470 [Muribaculaceae bacterium]|nr:hypothetical protein [Muribaculaceae bacterium]MDE6134192.1 hypothetical protein [Muribaculaceae bacterium]